MFVFECDTLAVEIEQRNIRCLPGQLQIWDVQSSLAFQTSSSVAPCPWLFSMAGGSWLRKAQIVIASGGQQRTLLAEA